MIRPEVSTLVAPPARSPRCAGFPRFTRSALATAFALGVFAGSPGPVSAQDGTAALARETILERGRAFTRAFHEGALDTIVVTFTPAMREAMPTVEALAQFRSGLRANLGTEAELLDENVRLLPGMGIYERTVRFANAPGVPMLVEWAFDSEGRVAGFSVRASEAAPGEAATPHLDYVTRARLRLPFDGEWTVFWGGRSVAENYHAAHVDQRFAYDFVVVQGGRTHVGEGRANTDYHCWDKDVLAPAAATVIRAVDGTADNPPGQMNPSDPPGNHVVLDLGNGEFAFLAHLRQGSVAVRPGEPVEEGQRLGACGNSGNSSEPHLHFHLQTTPDFGAGEGLPAFFRGYEADGRPVPHGEPVQGERIRHRGIS